MKNKGNNRKKQDASINIDFGLGGIFKGVASLVDMVTELAEHSPTEVRKEKVVTQGEGEKETKAVYGFSVKVGVNGQPEVERFGNVYEKEEGKGPVVDDVREPLVDTFDEGEYLHLVAELPGVEEAGIHYEIKQDILSIVAETGERKYFKEILLSSAVDEKKSTIICKNGILEMKLWKVQES